MKIVFSRSNSQVKENVEKKAPESERARMLQRNEKNFKQRIREFTKRHTLKKAFQTMHMNSERRRKTNPHFRKYDDILPKTM